MGKSRLAITHVPREVRIGVVVPFGNEETTVEAFLREVSTYLRQEDAIFCVLDTVSQDRTRERIKAEKKAARAAAKADRKALNDEPDTAEPPVSPDERQD